MQTTTLVIGLVQLFGAVCGFYSAVFAFESLPLVGLFMVFGIVNGACGTNNTLESLFGDDGLICPVFGKVDADDDE